MRLIHKGIDSQGPYLDVDFAAWRYEMSRLSINHKGFNWYRSDAKIVHIHPLRWFPYLRFTRLRVRYRPAFALDQTTSGDRHRGD